jgi:hypothetical protein
VNNDEGYAAILYTKSIMQLECKTKGLERCRKKAKTFLILTVKWGMNLLNFSLCILNIYKLFILSARK